MTDHLTDEDREALAKAIEHLAEAGCALAGCSESIPAAVEAIVSRHVIELAERRGAEKALRDAATAWQDGGWADVLLPHPEPPANPTLARASRVLDWLRARADQIGGA